MKKKHLVCLMAVLRLSATGIALSDCFQINSIGDTNATFNDGRQFTFRSHLGVNWLSNSGGGYTGLYFPTHNNSQCQTELSCNSTYFRLRFQRTAGGEGYVGGKIYWSAALYDYTANPSRIDQLPGIDEWFVWPSLTYLSLVYTMDLGHFTDRPSDSPTNWVVSHFIGEWNATYGVVQQRATNNVPIGPTCF